MCSKRWNPLIISYYIKRRKPKQKAIIQSSMEQVFFLILNVLQRGSRVSLANTTPSLTSTTVKKPQKYLVYNI